MKASRLLELLQRWGVRFSFEKRRLVVRGMQTADVRELVKRHRRALTNALRGQDAVIESLEGEPLVIEYAPNQRFVSIPRGYRGDVIGRLEREASGRVLAEFEERVGRRELDRRWRDHVVNERFPRR